MRCLLLLLLALFSLCYCKMQNVTVKGTAICNKKRLADTVVQLWERDTLDPNDLFAEVKTNKQGEFQVTGGENEVGSIEPFLRIKHNCNVKKVGCIRTSEYEITKKFINGATYDMTYVTLDIVSAVDSEKC